MSLALYISSRILDFVGRIYLPSLLTYVSDNDGVATTR